MPESARRTAEALDLLTWYPYRWALSYLPPGAELLSGQVVGRVAASLQPAEVMRCERNVRRGLPGHPDPSAVARQSLVTRYLDYTSSLSFHRMGRAGVERYLRFEGLEHLQEAQRRSRGVILAHPCMGPVRLGLTGLGLVGSPVVRLGLPELEDADGEPSFVRRQASALRRDLEARAPGAVLDGRGYLRPLLRLLQEGQTVAMCYDGTPPDAGEQIGRRVELEILGHRVRFPVGPIYLALRSGATVVPMSVARREGGAGYTVVLEPALELEHRDDVRETLRHNASRLAAHLERAVQRDPGGWQFWSEFEPGRFLL